MNDGRANALSLQMLSELHEALDRSVAEESTVVLTGFGSNFSGGFDLNLIRSANAQTKEMLDLGYRLAVRLLEHPSPVAIACNGSAVAMAAILLLCGDFRIGVDGPYKIVTNEVSIGMPMPWTGIEICRNRLAPSLFGRAVHLAEPFSPTESVSAGFLDRTVTPEELGPTAMAKAVELSRLNRAAFVTTKQRTQKALLDAIQKSLRRDEVDIQRFITG